MFGIFKKLDLLNQLEILEKKLQPADIQGKNHCCRSGFCCWRRPGCIAEDEVPKIAALLGITPRELFQTYLVVDSLEEGTLSLLPSREHQSLFTGEMLSSDEAFSVDTPCVFLDQANNNACKIQDVKPKECADFKCWEKESFKDHIVTVSREFLIGLGWDGKNVYDAN